MGNGSKYCRMLPLGHSAILLTCIKQKLVLKTKTWVFILCGRLRQVLRYIPMKVSRLAVNSLNRQLVIVSQVHDKLHENMSMFISLKQ